MARGDSVRRGIINPNATNSLVLFLFGSIVAGFAAGLGWGLATKILEKNEPAVESFVAKRIKRANVARARARYYGY